MFRITRNNRAIAGKIRGTMIAENRTAITATIEAIIRARVVDTKATSSP